MRLFNKKLVVTFDQFGVPVYQAWDEYKSSLSGQILPMCIAIGYKDDILRGILKRAKEIYMGRKEEFDYIHAQVYARGWIRKLFEPYKVKDGDCEVVLEVPCERDKRRGFIRVARESGLDHLAKTVEDDMDWRFPMSFSKSAPFLVALVNERVVEPRDILKEYPMLEELADPNFAINLFSKESKPIDPPSFVKVKGDLFVFAKGEDGKFGYKGTSDEVLEEFMDGYPVERFLNFERSFNAWEKALNNAPIATTEDYDLFVVKDGIEEKILFPERGRPKEDMENAIFHYIGSVIHREMFLKRKKPAKKIDSMIRAPEGITIISI